MLDENVLEDILESSRFTISEIKPSEWSESKIIMPQGSAFAGKFSYNLTPYAREIVDCVGANHPARKIAVMKGAQIGLSSGVLRPAIGYTIENNPANILFLIGNDALVDAGMNQLDQMIDNAGIRKLIKSNLLKPRQNRTGDTTRRKEFFGGTLLGGSANNNKIIAQLDIQLLIVDDFDLVKNVSSIDGDMRKLYEQRTAAYAHKSKIIYVSTPRIKSTSNILQAFEQGDKRYFNVPCPNCREHIVLNWNVESLRGNKICGITYALNSKGLLEKNSVGYICQACEKFFDDSVKYEMNLKGVWVPTQVPKEENFYSYQISSLYAPAGMKSWKDYVVDYIEANPQNENRKEAKHHTFTNLCLGEPYEPQTNQLSAIQIQKNVREYEVGIIPDVLANEDGNGEFIFLTCGVDLNGRYNYDGKEDDVRIDYSITAWFENGSSYSIEHGSIGNYVPYDVGERKKEHGKTKYTYNHSSPLSAWNILEKVLQKEFPLQSNPNVKRKIIQVCIDTGYSDMEAFQFIYKNIFYDGVKGSVEDKFKSLDRITPNFKVSSSNPRLYILDVHNLKEELAARMRMRWNARLENQPSGFMNFPKLNLEQVQNGEPVILYQYTNFFSHFEAEVKHEKKNENGEVVGFVWKKKYNLAQNHFWDCEIYNMAAKEIFIKKFLMQFGMKSFSWNTFVEKFLETIGKQKTL